MHSEHAPAAAAAHAGIGHNSGHAEQAHAGGYYKVQCHAYPGGPLLWEERIDNLVTTAGKNFALDTIMAGSAYTAAWYLGLVSSSGYSALAAADTAASHAGWTESTAYSNSTRPAASWSAASAGAKALSAGVVFNINATDTMKGCLLISNSTKGGTTGTLYSVGLFSGGDQPVVSGNTLTVTYTASL